MKKIQFKILADTYGILSVGDEDKTSLAWKYATTKMKLCEINPNQVDVTNKISD